MANSRMMISADGGSTKTLGAIRPAPAPKPKPQQASPAQPRPSAPSVDLTRKADWTKDLWQSHREQKAQSGGVPMTFGQIMTGYAPNQPPIGASPTDWADIQGRQQQAQKQKQKQSGSPLPPLPTDATPPEPTAGVRELLNERDWKLPKKGKTASMPKSSFDKKGFTDLKEHDYRITPEEWDRIKATYSTPGALSAGYVAPANPPAVSVDDNMPLMHLGEQESAALTWDAYEDLSKGQRAAIDFNTLLVDAREADLKKGLTLSDAAKTDYDAKVEKLFGAGRGSEVTAINTVDLLTKLDMKLVGQDLDEYLSLERAIDTTELSDFKFSKQDIKALDTLINGQAPTYAEVRTPANLAAIDTAGIQNAQQMIKTSLTNPGAVSYNFDTLVYGKSSDMADMQGQPPIGYGDSTTQWGSQNEAYLDEWFKKGIGVLATPDLSQTQVPKGTNPMSWLLGDLNAMTKGDKKIQQQFLDYLANEVSVRGQYGSTEDTAMAALISKRAGLGG